MAKILVVEDDVMIADFLEEILVDAGHSICGIATTVAQAAKLGNLHRPDLAILDLRLDDGGLGTEVVPLLTECGRVGILYATGNDNIDLTRANGDVCIRKPYMAPRVTESTTNSAENRCWLRDHNPASRQCPCTHLKQVD